MSRGLRVGVVPKGFRIKPLRPRSGSGSAPRNDWRTRINHHRSNITPLESTDDHQC